MNSKALELLGKPHWGPMRTPYLAPGRIVIWRLPLALYPAALAWMNPLLSSTELRRLARFHQLPDRMRFILGRVGLRLLLSRYLNLPPNRVDLHAGPGGKPYLLKRSGMPLHFNLSHSGDWVLIGLGTRPIGLDMEHLDPTFSYMPLLPECFSAREIRFIQSDSLDSLRRFYLLWTRKEAFLKRIGTGLMDTLAELDVLYSSKIPNRANASIRDEHSTTPGIKSFFMNRHYVGSICQQPAPEQIDFREFSLNHFKFPG